MTASLGYLPAAKRRAAETCPRAEAQASCLGLARRAGVEEKEDPELAANRSYMSVLELGIRRGERPDNVVNDRGVDLVPRLVLPPREGYYCHIHEGIHW